MPPARALLGGAPLARLALLVEVISACTSLFGIDVPPLRKTAGAGGEGGADAGGTRNASAGDGFGLSDGVGATGGDGPFPGTGGDDGGRSSGAAGPGGKSDGNVGGGGAGRAGSGGSAKGGLGGAGAVAGKSGAGGAPLMEHVAVEGKPCSAPGARACQDQAQGFSLICDGETWTHQTCSGTNQYCDRRSGLCEPAIRDCEDQQPGQSICRWADNLLSHVSVHCGPDLVTAEIEQCVFDCHGSTCDPPGPNELVIEHAPPIIAFRSYWPPPSGISGSGLVAIPVCVKDAGRLEWAFIREDVERTWGRYGGVYFAGWGECSDGSKGVVVELDEASDDVCSDQLGSIDRVGYPGLEGTSTIHLCASFGNGATTSETLLQLVARHEFGHVLGFIDGDPPFSTYDFMARAYGTVDLSTYEFRSMHVALVQDAYGYKPRGAVVDRRGNCLTARDGMLDFAPCDGSPEQVFHLTSGQLMNEASGACVHAPLGAGATEVPCASAGSELPSDDAWHPKSVEMRAFGAMCLAHDGSYITSNDCPPAGPPTTAWEVEFVDAGARVRLREAGTNTCLWFNSRWNAGAVTPGDCDTCADVDPECPITDRFDFNDLGQLSQDGICMKESTNAAPDGSAAPGGGFPLGSPCIPMPSMMWTLSGRLESGSGSVLTRSFKAGAPALSAQAIDASSDDQLFDIYFSQAVP